MHEHFTIMPDIREITPTAAHYIQSRAQMDFALVDEYAQMMRDGVEFEPALGLEDADGTIYVYDGYHRGEAAKHINAMLRVRVIPGTRQDAEWLAFAANKTHGLRRTHADIERIVKNALAHPKAANLSDREIARHCGTDHKTVGNWRKRMERDAKQQRADSDDAADRRDIDRMLNTQTEIEGTERNYTIEEIEAVIMDYISAASYAEQIGMLQNVIMRTVAGMAYTREIQSHLKTKNYTDNAYYAAARAVQTRLQQATIQEAMEMADIAARQQPEPEMQMRCVVCRAQFPASQLTYKTGLCPACLSDQLYKLAADNRMMAAAFKVLDRMLTVGLAAEVKREIYEEMYAPTSAPESEPDEPHIAEPRERVLYYKQQGLSVRKIADALKTEGIVISKSAVGRIIQEHKEAQI